MGVGGQPQALAALPPRKTRYPSYRRLGGPQGRSGRVRKISPPPGFDPRTVLPVESLCTDYAIQAPYGKRPLGISRCLWEEKIRTDLQLWYAPVWTAARSVCCVVAGFFMFLNLGVPQTGEKYLTSSTNIRLFL